MPKDPRVECLLKFGKSIKPRDLFPVLVDEAALTIEQNPFAFALAAVLDRGTKSEIIWTIPYYLEKQVGRLSPELFARMPLEELSKIFYSLPSKPRYISDAPKTVRALSRMIQSQYGGDVTKIWVGRTASYVKNTFQGVYGVGPGISSMIVLLLERCYGIKFTDIDHKAMNVKPDVHVIRVFNRLGFITERNEAAALEAAKRLNPEYPGALDPPTWVIGKRWCTPWETFCSNCPVDKVCQKKV